MTVIAASSDRSICVDRTEVTSAQYAAFITATSTLDPWKDAVPKACKSLALAALDAPDDGGDLPRVTVSFCSAAYFCAAQGKRICGSLADGGAVVVEAGAGDPPLEWEGACANGQDRSFYPWGTQAPEPAIAAGCLTKSSNPDANAPRAAGGAPQCAPSPTEGPFDMIGNVWEWVNLRSDGAGVSYTAVRGGSYAEPTVIYGCASPHGIDAPPGAFAAGHAAVGFRCCADPKP